MKKLRVIIKREFFDAIASGEKKEEYRDCSDYWQSRLLTKEGDDIVYDLIEFVAGYSKNAPKMLVEYKGVEIGEYDDSDGNKENDGNYFFIIKLGEIIKELEPAQ